MTQEEAMRQFKIESDKFDELMIKLGYNKYSFFEGRLRKNGVPDKRTHEGKKWFKSILI